MTLILVFGLWLAPAHISAMEDDTSTYTDGRIHCQIIMDGNASVKVPHTCAEVAKIINDNKE